MKEDVLIIHADNNSELLLDTVTTFGSSDVTLISYNINTSYTFDYKCYELECSKYIIKITSSKSFKMIKGILKYGIFNTSLTSSSSHLFYFVDISDDGYLSLSYINLIFVGMMKSMIYMRGGTVYIEKMKIINEEWVEPLIEIYETVSSIIVEIYMINIIKCNYCSYSNIESPEKHSYKSGIIFISDESTKNVLVNISNCLLDNIVSNLFYNGKGGIFHFSGLSEKSSMT
jgi:hypothetical protein